MLCKATGIKDKKLFCILSHRKLVQVCLSLRTVFLPVWYKAFSVSLKVKYHSFKEITVR